MFTLTGSSSRDSILFSPSAVWLVTGDTGGRVAEAGVLEFYSLTAQIAAIEADIQRMGKVPAENIIFFQAINFMSLFRP